MDKVSVTMRVLFEDPFWIGVLERVTENGLSVCKFPFGAEPKDYEVYGFLMENYYRLRFSPAVEFSLREMRRSPKRRQTAAVGIGTKSQQALQMQREAVKTERRIISREQKEAEKQRQFELKQQKKKEKHRGR
ncbi:YjdF family protein [[Clostridium] symbiosum]|uniref:YjdF family protein n=1 Tax=Clostridium symbiosum TaxID=1512 RepID=UPI002109F531|nr:YjdF family protein [[Clostridium] symbiosum]MCQ4990448.1 YjdF family protein [[Clostridium] symbiosum]